MKITGIRPVGVRVNRRGDWIFLLVDTDQGLTGLGEASHSGNDALLFAMVSQIEDALIGRDPADINALRALMAKQTAGRIGATAWSAVEQACQDVRGQALGLPISSLLGGRVRDRVRLYANINRHVEERSPAGFARAAAAAADEGFTAIKLAPFDEVAPSDRPRSANVAAWRTGVERVKAVREAVGSEVEVAVDCHSRFDPKEALNVAAALQNLSLLWFEEPVSVDRVQDLAFLRQRIHQPLATAESLFGASAFASILGAGAADVVMPDVKHAGGIQETLHVGLLAESHGAAFAPHNPSGPAATAASVHVAACARSFSILEFAWGEADWRADLLDPAEEIVEGHIEISNRPGLGHRLNPEILKRYGIDSPSRSDSSKAGLNRAPGPEFPYSAEARAGCGRQAQSSGQSTGGRPDGGNCLQTGGLPPVRSLVHGVDMGRGRGQAVDEARLRVHAGVRLQDEGLLLPLRRPRSSTPAGASPASPDDDRSPRTKFRATRASTAVGGNSGSRSSPAGDRTTAVRRNSAPTRPLRAVSLFGPITQVSEKLHAMHAQNHRKGIGPAAVPDARIVRPDARFQLRPRIQAVHAFQEGFLAHPVFFPQYSRSEDVGWCAGFFSSDMSGRTLYAAIRGHDQRVLRFLRQ